MTLPKLPWILLALACAACSSRVADNPYLDGGNASLAFGESCSRDSQCAAPYRCWLFTCGTVPDAAVAPDAAVPDAAHVPDAAVVTSSSSVMASSSLASGSSGMGSSSGIGSSSVGGSASGGASSGPVGAALGADCAQDADCQSNLCKAVFSDATKVCVKDCAQASDCGNDGLFFCDPLTVGASNGYCVPRSPAHCQSCAVDGDCGKLSETCVTPPGEGSPVCQVDCSLGGSAACPPAYACTSVMVGGQAHQLCRPNAGACADTKGGFCDRSTSAQPCDPASDAGSCTGTRTCGGDHRFTACSVSAPACRGTCATAQPAGCTVGFCASAVSTATNCGTCGTVCPGNGQPAAAVTCVGSMTCNFACVGENYDVDNSTSNGCEADDAPVGNHAQAQAQDVGTFSCSDGSSAQNINGNMPSDARTHVPAITGFNAATGTAPDWMVIHASGGVCTNDLVLTLQVPGSTSPTCFVLTVITSAMTYTCTANASGTCGISGTYSDDTDILIKVEKTCGLASLERAAYQVTGHL